MVLVLVLALLMVGCALVAGFLIGWPWALAGVAGALTVPLVGQATRAWRDKLRLVRQTARAWRLKRRTKRYVSQVRTPRRGTRRWLPFAQGMEESRD
ncbi:hypothetical protein [Streptomyces sp. YGL11-2]|uniref:hypothetical protein n=1 Tax=Streptomyces sp. YGL11-2 TaxID=3414028 RepID=UPI003CF1310F